MARRRDPSHLRRVEWLLGRVFCRIVAIAVCGLGLGRRLRPSAVDSRRGGLVPFVGRGLRVLGSSPTMVVCIGALELGSPFPSQTPSSTSAGPVKPHEAGRYPNRPLPSARLPSELKG